MKISSVVFIALAGNLVGSNSFADANEVYETSNFSYELHTTDIFAWLDGRKSGAVEDEQGLVAKKLEAILDSAQEHISLAVYGTQRQSWFLETLDRLKQRRIGMTAVVDQKSGEYGQWQAPNFIYPMTVRIPKIVGANKVLPDLNSLGRIRTSSFMHNKYIVVDSKDVWTGSTNISHTCLGAEYNANLSIKVHSPILAEVFTREFEQMYQDRDFSGRKSPSHLTPHVRFQDGTLASAYFSPQDRVVENALIPAIESAQESIEIAIFFFTHQVIADALIEAHQRGVRIRMILDALAARHPSSKHQLLRDAGIEVRVETWGGKMHMKAAAIDRDQTLIGSMNWTVAGDERNDENLLVIKHNRRLNEEFKEYYYRLWRSLDGPIAQGYPSPEGWESGNSCFDGMDNDYRLGMDSEDPKCDPNLLVVNVFKPLTKQISRDVNQLDAIEPYDFSVLDRP